MNEQTRWLWFDFIFFLSLFLWINLISFLRNVILMARQRSTTCRMTITFFYLKWVQHTLIWCSWLLGRLKNKSRLITFIVDALKKVLSRKLYPGRDLWVLRGIFGRKHKFDENLPDESFFILDGNGLLARAIALRIKLSKKELRENEASSI